MHDIPSFSFSRPARLEQPQAVRIEQIVDEAKNIKSFYFSLDADCKAGQFLMVWLPGVGMKPMAVSSQSGKLASITTAAVGSFSKRLFELKVGDRMGVQGPYGKPFDLDAGKSFVLVGGGYGTATMVFLADQLLAKNKKVTMICGARSKEYLLYTDRFKAMKMETLYCTDDGSFGRKGFVTQALKEALKEKPDCICTCGPEPMMKAVLGMAQEAKIRCQLSIERYMKCGIGICGSCCIDPTGERICTEGTVFDAKRAAALTEFGRYHRDGSATRHDF
ncbi:MAG: dihydroorotate dehydrogenase electron transfer subunit [Candidatus Aenigmarchaeota archaeon]|nr:dihydroorotate dehydrogenase electron transfer subunit [Candidatus Aenigmarchaeota archaeon]